MFFPVMIDVAKLNVLIVGGGNIAYRKLKSILEFDANVKLVSKEVSTEIIELSNTYKFDIVCREFCERDIYDMQFVIAATDDADVNNRISDICKSRNILVNNVGDHSRCSVINTAFEKCEIDGVDAVVSVSFFGKNPSGLKKIKRKLKEIFNDISL